MTTAFNIVVCGSLVPDPLQTLEPIQGPTGPALKNEMMLPSVLDPWAGHSLFEAANLAKQNNYDGMEIDFEGKPASLENYFSTFLMGLKQRLGTKTLACDIEARTPLGDAVVVAKLLRQGAEIAASLN